MKTIVIRFLRILSLLVLTLLNTFVFDSAVHAENIGRNVSLINLIATPERYDKKLVFVTDYASIGLENMSLCLAERTASAKDCIWLNIDSGPYDTDEDMRRYQSKEKIWKQFHEKIVSVRGTFDKKDTGHFGMWSGGIKNIVDVYGANTHVPFRRR